MSINKVMITGNITRNAESRSFPSGGSVVSFGVAVNERRKNGQGNWEDYPNYFDCSMFGTRADKICQYLTKGTKVAIEGKLRWHQWDDKASGAKRSKIDIVVDEIEFLSSRPNQGDGNGNGNSYGNSYAAPSANSYGNPAGNSYGNSYGNGSANGNAYGNGGYSAPVAQPAPVAPAVPAPVQNYVPQAQAQPIAPVQAPAYSETSFDGDSYGESAPMYREMPDAPAADAYADEDIPF